VSMNVKLIAFSTRGTLMNDADLVKQLNTYADAVVAFSFGQSILFLYSIGKGDNFTRNLLAWPLATTFGTVVMTALYIAVVIRCHKSEEYLVVSLAKRDKSDKITKTIRRGRVGIIVFMGFVCCLIAIIGHFHQPLYDCH
jgi:hypothetical protein